MNNSSDNYRGWIIEELIGEGSYGKVYRVKKAISDSLYYSALKIIQIPSQKDEIEALKNEGMDEMSISTYYSEIVDELKQEIDVLMSLRGLSNIVYIEDYDVETLEDGFTHVLTIRMELLTDLNKYVNKFGLSKKDVLQMGIDLAEGLKLCHDNNIIHRDIKPENIFVTKNRSFKLGDFGVAKKLETTVGHYSKKGTYMYMAPEIYLNHTYNTTVDVYSLGLVMYRYLNKGLFPFVSSHSFTRKEKEEALLKRLSATAISLPQSGDGDLERIVLKALAFHKEDRYQSIDDMLFDLKNVNLSNEQESTILMSALSVDGNESESNLALSKSTVQAMHTHDDYQQEQTQVLNTNVKPTNPITSSKLHTDEGIKKSERSGFYFLKNKKIAIAFVVVLLLFISGAVGAYTGFFDDLLHNEQASTVDNENPEDDDVSQIDQDNDHSFVDNNDLIVNRTFPTSPDDEPPLRSGPDKFDVNGKSLYDETVDFAQQINGITRRMYFDGFSYTVIYNDITIDDVVIFGKDVVVAHDVTITIDGELIIDRDMLMYGNIVNNGKLTMGGYLTSRRIQNDSITANGDFILNPNFEAYPLIGHGEITGNGNIAVQAFSVANEPYPTIPLSILKFDKSTNTLSGYTFPVAEFLVNNEAFTQNIDGTFDIVLTEIMDVDIELVDVFGASSFYRFSKATLESIGTN